MATVNVLIDTRRKRKDNKVPIVIRVTHFNKSKQKAIASPILLNEWDDKRCKMKGNSSLAKHTNHLIDESLHKAKSARLIPTNANTNLKTSNAFC